MTPIHAYQRSTGYRFLLFASFLFVDGAGCGGTTSSTTTTGGGNPLTGSSLVMTCTNICNNVLLDCSVPQAVYMTCLNDCQTLNLVQSTCITDFAAYLSCVAGANSVSCGAGGQYVLLSPPSCNSQQQAYAVCTGGPPLAACIEVSSSSTKCASNASHPHALLCVGAPAGCDSAGAGLFGPYCCP